eukprot:1148445-Pelagomonas_calceolata.AAC.5
MAFSASGTDPGLFIEHMEEEDIYILVYVDDVLIATKRKDNVKSVLDILMTKFDAKDIEASYFLG